MKKNESNVYRSKLEAMVRRLSQECSNLQNETLCHERQPGLCAVPDLNSADDLSKESADEDVALTVLDIEEDLLGDCVAALSRIEEGTFGTCEGCGWPISRRRLVALPYARECMRCARKSALFAGNARIATLP